MNTLPSDEHPGWGRLLQAVLGDDAGRRDDASAHADDPQPDTTSEDQVVVRLPNLVEQARA